MQSNIKRLFSLALALIMVLSCVPVMAFAAEDSSVTYVAENTTTGVQYADLNEAITAAQAGQIVQVLADSAESVVYNNEGVILDLNGHDLSNVTVPAEVTLSAIDSATDDYEGSFGTLSGTVEGQIAATVKTTGEVKSYVTVTENGSYSFHRYYAAIAAISLKPAQAALGYRAEFRGDEVVKNAVVGYGYELWLNDGAHKTYSRTDALEKSSLTLRLKNILAEGNDSLNALGSTATIGGNAFMTLNLNGQEITLPGTEQETSLRQVVESVNASAASYGQAQLEQVRAMITTYAAWMEGWATEAIFGNGEGTEGGDGLKVEITVDVTAENNVLTQDATLSNEDISVTVPQGTVLENGTTQLVLTITEKASTDSNVSEEEGYTLLPLDVHIQGISADNTTPIIVCLGEVLPKGLNIGNYELYHVESGETVAMTRVYSVEELDTHNEFYYDPATGAVTVAMASFSEITLRSTAAKWTGEADHTWYDANATTLYIYNADQLWSFSQIVGGMAKDEEGNAIAQDSFADKTVILHADIDLNDAEANNQAHIFYPIGYYNNTNSYNKMNESGVTSGFKTFEGTFDGNGHTISNFYQNTWEMFGDYNDGYAANSNHYRDGMGLFGKVYGGTVKNLTVKNFSSDGEFTTTGTIAAYADCGATFENIAIFNCNPRVYNIGNGGIVGCVGWYTKDVVDTPVTLSNITVDNTNKISALWGSWDVACGGLVGQYYPNSGQTPAIDNAGIHMENCHVAAQIDVNNDVCANYQYYAYRYAGMLVGSVRENIQGDGSELYPDTGRVYPNMDGITASNCTVHYGTWNDYYYCELVANSQASYTHDYQFSRLTQVAKVNGTTITYLDGTTGTVPASGRYNYVVVDGEHATENATCYHFVDGAAWDHATAGKEDLDGDGVAETLIENNQHIYLEFYDQLVTGYGWGVTSMGIADIEGVTVLDREIANSVEKFETVENVETEYTSGAVISIGDLFKAASADVAIDVDAVQVFVSPVDKENSTVKGTYAANTSDWTKGILVLTGAGDATISITDYNYCKETVLNVTVTATSAGGQAYVKVTEAPADWSGEYLIVCETDQYVFNSSLDEMDAISNYKSVTITNSTISKTEGDSYKFTIASVEGGYSIQGVSGKYIGHGSDANELTSSATALLNTISLNDDGTANIICGGGAYLRFNATSGQTRFRYYKSGSYTNQKAIALYKLGSAGESCTHDDAEIVVTAPTCESTGSVIITCDCGYTVTETIAQLDHSYVDGNCEFCGTSEPTFYVKTELANITSKQQVIITMTKGDVTYALYSGNGGSSAPTAVVVDVVDGKIETNEPNIYWNITNNNGELTIYSHGDTENWLYCISNNNGVRVGNSENNVFTITDGYLYNVGQERYIGVYAPNPDWRSYTSINSNIENQALAFYVLDKECTHQNTEAVDAVAPTCGKVGYTAGIQCVDCGHYVSGHEIVSVTGEHSYESVVTAPTCTEAGFTTFTCSVCGDNYTEEGDAATGHSYEEKVTTAATCTEDGVKTFTCSNCDDSYTEVIEAIGHTTDNGTCDKCGQTIGGSTEPTEPTVVATFEFGANGTATHSDGSEETSYSETATGYTLTFESMSKVYGEARDAKGNSCLKLGTGSAEGSFSFTVPAEVSKVIIHVAGYKANTAKITVNGTSYTISTLSNNGAYTGIEIDTSTTKTISFTTVSGSYRAMVNTIEYYAVQSGGNAGSGDEGGSDVEVATETISVAGSTGTLASDSSSISWAGQNFNIVSTKGSTAIRTSDTDHFRLYQNSKTTISGTKNITKIVFTCTSDSYATVLKTSLENAGYTVSVSGSVVTVTLTETVTEVAFTASAQTRVSKVEITCTNT